MTTHKTFFFSLSDIATSMVTFTLHWFTSSRSSYVVDKLRNVHMYLKLIGLIYVLPKIYVLNISDVTGQSHFEAPLGAAKK